MGSYDIDILDAAFAWRATGNFPLSGTLRVDPGEWAHAQLNRIKEIDFKSGALVAGMEKNCNDLGLWYIQTQALATLTEAGIFEGDDWRSSTYHDAFLYPPL